jgi:hypothetical protein
MVRILGRERRRNHGTGSPSVLGITTSIANALRQFARRLQKILVSRPRRAEQPRVPALCGGARHPLRGAGRHVDSRVDKRGSWPLAQ